MQTEIAGNQTELFNQPIDTGLPKERSQWPQSALESFWSLLAELNSWSRTTNHSHKGNGWIAENAVREVWSVEQGHC